MERIRQNTIAKNGNDFWYRQEFLCDWGQASSTSYYGEVMQRILERGQIGRFPLDPAYPVYTSWDLGMSDSTAIGFWQRIGLRTRFIDYHETHDIGLTQIVKYVLAKPYHYGWHFLPHDGSVRDSDAVQRIQKAQDAGLIDSSLLRRTGVEDGIELTVTGLDTTDFNEATTEGLRRKLILYKRKFNPLTGDYMGPEHKTESHAADQTRYAFTAIHQDFDERTGLYLYSPENAQTSYKSKLITQPPMYRSH